MLSSLMSWSVWRDWSKEIEHGCLQFVQWFVWVPPGGHRGDAESPLALVRVLRTRAESGSFLHDSCTVQESLHQPFVEPLEFVPKGQGVCFPHRTSPGAHRTSPGSFFPLLIVRARAAVRFVGRVCRASGWTALTCRIKMSHFQFHQLRSKSTSPPTHWKYHLRDPQGNHWQVHSIFLAAGPGPEDPKNYIYI